MKFICLVWIVPSLTALLVPLKGIKECTVEPTDEASILNEADAIKYVKYFAIPLGTDDKKDFETYYVIAGTKFPHLEFPAKNESKIKGITTDYADLCWKSTATVKDLQGTVYFVKEDYTDVYHYPETDNPETNYLIEVTKKYTIVFSKSKNGSTLNFTKIEGCSFKIHSGVPEDENKLLYTYDSSMGLDEIYIQEEVFYIENTGEQGTDFKFTVADGGVYPSKKTFGDRGFIMTPEFPSKPDESDMNVNIISRPVERTITFKMSAVQSPVSPVTTTTPKEEFTLTEFSNDDVPTVKTVDIKVGVTSCSFPTIVKYALPGGCTLHIPANTSIFNIGSPDSAYLIQFEIKEDETKTTAVPVTTTKPNVAPDGTCSPCSPCSTTTCPITTSSPSTCPPVTSCNCSTPTIEITSTTEIPTTTMEATTSTVTSLITILFVYYIF